MAAKTKPQGGHPGAFRSRAYQAGLAALYGTARADSTAARARYSGFQQPNAQPSPRDPLTVAGELRAAAQHLCDLADDLAAGVMEDGALSGADALLVGCGRLVVELRQRGQVSP
jgi:hypothetical protein